MKISILVPTDTSKDTLKSKKDHGAKLEILSNQFSDLPKTWDNCNEKSMKIKLNSDDDLFLKKL